MTRARSVRAEQRALVATMRRDNATWPQVAEAIRDRWGVNMRVAMRAAHGWSQGDVAERWTARWPEDPKTHKAISSWELWPGPSGHQPSFETLERLAEIYECGVPDLLSDTGGYGHRDTGRQARAAVAAELPVLLGADTAGTEPASDPATGGSLVALADWLDQASLPDLAGRVSEVTAGVGDPVTRRRALAKLAAALSLVAAEPLSAMPAAASDSSVGSPGEPTGGVWRSRYSYYSSGRAREFEGEHLLQLRRSGGRLYGKSLPTMSGSFLELDLSISGSVITGTWAERTSPTGYYRGATYHGALQLLANPTGRLLAGQWLGYGKDGAINTGSWTLEWVDRPSEVARYRAKG